MSFWYDQKVVFLFGVKILDHNASVRLVDLLNLPIESYLAEQANVLNSRLLALESFVNVEWTLCKSGFEDNSTYQKHNASKADLPNKTPDPEQEFENHVFHLKIKAECWAENVI